MCCAVLRHRKPVPRTVQKVPHRELTMAAVHHVSHVHMPMLQNRVRVPPILRTAPLRRGPSMSYISSAATPSTKLQVASLLLSPLAPSPNTPIYAAGTTAAFFGFVPFICLVPAAFLPGLPSTAPFAFSIAPSTLSLGVAFFLVAVLGFATRPLVTPVRFLPVLALGLVAVPVFFARGLRAVAGEVLIASMMRGLELPVEPRVRAIARVGWVGCVREVVCWVEGCISDEAKVGTGW
jgi:hypothetical protein